MAQIHILTQLYSNMLTHLLIKEENRDLYQNCDTSLMMLWEMN